MKLKYLMLISLILTILTISAVSATDTSDALAVDNTVGDEISPVNDGLLADGDNPDGDGDDGSNPEGENEYPEEDYREDVSSYARCPSEVSVDDDYAYIGVKIPDWESSDITGNITISIDGNKIYEEPVEVYGERYDDELDYDVEFGGNIVYIKDLGLSQGNYDVTISYSGDDNYLPFSQNYILNINFITVEWSSKLEEGSDIYIYLASNATGNVEIFIDDKSYLNLTATQLHEYNSVTIKNLGFDRHTYKITYSDDELYSLDEPITGEFDYVYDFEVYLDNGDDIYYGDTLVYKVRVPSSGNGIIVVSLNGKKFNVTPSTTESTRINITDYNLGQNQINFTYVDEKYPQKTIEKSFYAEAKVMVPYEVGYGSGDAISLTLPKDTIGNLAIYKGVYNETTGENDWILTANITLKDGKASYPLSDLPLGEYSLEITYDGNYSEYVQGAYGYTIKVIPNIIIDQEVYEQANDNVKIILPDDYNKTLIVKIIKTEYDEDLDDHVVVFEKVIYNDTAKGTLNLNIPNLEYGYGYDYYLLVDEFEKEFSYNTWVDVPENITSKKENIEVQLSGKEGYVSLYIDGKLYQTEALDEDGWAVLTIKDLQVKNHTYEISYFNTKNEKILTKTGSFDMDYELSTNLWRDFYSLTKEFELVVGVPEDATGTINVVVNGKTYTANHINGTATVIITNLIFGENNVTITYNGDNKYPSKTIKKTIDVTSYEIFEKYDDDRTVSVSLLLPGEAKGNLTLFKATYDEYESTWISTGEVVKTVKLVDGYAEISIPEFPIGYYQFVASYIPEDENDYGVEDCGFEFTILPDMNITSEIFAGQNATISIYIPNAEGVINVYGWDEEGEKILLTTISSDNGTFKTSLSDLTFGENGIQLEYVGEDYENMFKDTFCIDVIPIKAEYKETLNDGTVIISLELFEGLSGTVTVYKLDYGEGDDTELLTISNYTSQNKTFAIKGLKPGFIDLRIVYSDDKYGEYSFKEGDINTKANAAANINIPDTINSDSFDVVLPEDATGGILVTIDGNTTYIPLVNGSAKVDVSNLPAGKHDITINYPGDKKYGQFVKTSTVTVPSAAVPVKIIAKDLSVQYLDGTKYSVTVYGTDGKLAVGAQVVFKINGKKVGTAKTNDKGIATLKITQVPKTYKITAEALGASVTKKLTVKQVLTLKKVKVKKSAKKLVLKATLKKVKGKYLKGKKITFKFNGKKYKAKTNKKGVAKVTIKKNVLKKLKVGKKVKYSATYSKTTVTKTVKINK